MTVTAAAWAVPAAPNRDRRTAQSAVSTVAVPEVVRRMIAYLVVWGGEGWADAADGTGDGVASGREALLRGERARGITADRGRPPGSGNADGM
ncbi:hypothetical protein GCM10010305_20660 [Streptomyces termitum]|uniref:Uncharacterized protein n=1 Tax=Streptomyces termitum TaxID=67368 RepID=A0A918SY21_9ACTN|nr:hypothetical protein GCM10010305_20660 [Streptomyces termitum]